MKIASIETYLFEYPLDKPFWPAFSPGQQHSVDRHIISRIITDEGVEGVGTMTAFNAAHAKMVKVVSEEIIGSQILGTEFENIETAFTLIERFGHALGGRPWLLEIALWDIVGKLAGKPLYAHWGGDRGQLDLYASTTEVVDPDRSPERAIQAREAGFGAIKVRAHHTDIRDDVRAIEAIRDAVGDTIEIMVDANQACPLTPDGPIWTLHTALEFAREMAGLNVYWLEEPLHRFNFDDLRKLREESEVRIAGGELNQGVHEFAAMINQGCLDVYQPDATFAGGPTASLAIANLVSEKGAMFSPHTWSNGIGFAVNAHIAAKVRGCPYIEFPYEPDIWPTEVWCSMLTECFTPNHGAIELGDAPGLGIVIDEDKMSKYAKRL